MMLLESRFGLESSDSLAKIHFPKYNAIMAPQWPWIMHATRGLADKWPATTFKHSIRLDCEGGVDVFSEEMTALFGKLKSGETPTTPRSTYEVCLYVLLALRDMIRRLSGSVTSYFIRIDYQEGKLMKLIDRKSVYVTFSLLLPQSILKFFFPMATCLVC